MNGRTGLRRNRMLRPLFNHPWTRFGEKFGDVCVWGLGTDDVKDVKVYAVGFVHRRGVGVMHE